MGQRPQPAEVNCSNKGNLFLMQKKAAADYWQRLFCLAASRWRLLVGGFLLGLGPETFQSLLTQDNATLRRLKFETEIRRPLNKVHTFRLTNHFSKPRIGM